jgi:glycosyltransferase involved in cell wall biosynthesis
MTGLFSRTRRWYQRSMRKGILFLRSNPVEPDPRVEREAITLAKNRFKVLVVAWDRENKYPVYETKKFGELYRIKVKAKFATGIRNMRQFIRWQLALFSFLVRNRQNYDYIHACDFDTIIPALICKLFLRKKVVYDIFDFYADMLRDVPDLLRRLIRRVDLFLIGFADAVIIADEGRIEQIKGSKPKKLVVIYNSPPLVTDFKESPLKKVSSNNLVIAYIGLLQRERGIFEMIDIVRNHPEWKLILGGYGAEEKEIKEKIKGLGNVEFLGRVPYEKALEVYASSDVMFATYDPRIPNHRYSSPNKLFEAMMLGKPIIVARNTGMDKIVEKYGLGFVVEYGNKKDLEKAITLIANWDANKWEAFKKHTAKIYSENFSWEIMERRLIDLYKSLEK